LVCAPAWQFPSMRSPHLNPSSSSKFKLQIIFHRYSKHAHAHNQSFVDCLYAPGEVPFKMLSGWAPIELTFLTKLICMTAKACKLPGGFGAISTHNPVKNFLRRLEARLCQRAARYANFMRRPPMWNTTQIKLWLTGSRARAKLNCAQTQKPGADFELGRAGGRAKSGEWPFSHAMNRGKKWRTK
jgi:hypothetical protein